MTRLGRRSHSIGTPYTTDLSIFEKPGRDERLKIQHLMDLLGHQNRPRSQKFVLARGGFQ
jgi:hypothetical protein